MGGEAANGDAGAVLSPEARYERQSLLGRGAMGEVWLARDRLLGREVAWKLASPGGAGRLRQEAALAARLDHPGIVPVLDAGVLADGAPWLAMRLVRGQTLAQILAKTPGKAERLRLLRPMLTVCEAVAHAHQHQVVHRDLKAANLMIGAFGEAQVLDWGLACAIADAAAEQRPVGTPLTMSPEVARGEPATPAADVYSLGALLFEVLTGAPLRSGSQEQVLGAAALGLTPPALPETVPPDLAAIVARCLAPAAERRYPTAAELAYDLEAFLDGRRVSSYQYRPSDLALRLLVAWKWPLLVGLTALVALAGLVVVSYVRIRAARDRAEQAGAAARTAAEQTRQALTRTDTALAQALGEHAAALLATGYPHKSFQTAERAQALAADPVAVGVLAARQPSPWQPGPALTGACGVARAFGWTDSDGVLRPGRLCLDNQQLLVQTDSWQWSVAAQVRDAAAGGALLGAIVTDPARPADIQLLQLWSLREGIALGPARPVGPRLHMTGGANRLALWNPGVLEVHDASGKRDLAGCSRLTAVALSGDGQWLARSCADGPIWLGALDQPDAYALAVDVSRGDEWPSALALSHDGRFLAGGGPRGRWIWWDRQTGQVARMHASTGATHVAAVVPGGAAVLLGVEKGDSALWRPAFAYGLWRLPAATDAVAGPDGTLVLVERDRGQTRRWSAGAPAAPHVWHAPESRGLTGLSLSPDGRRLTVSGGDGELWLLDAATQQLLAERRWPGGVAKRAAFSPDGTRLLVPVLAQRSVAELDAQTLADAAPLLPLATRRALWFGHEQMAVVSFGAPALLTGTPSQPQPGVGGDGEAMADAAVTPDGRTALWLGETTGTVWMARWPEAPLPLRVAQVALANAIGVARNGQFAVVAGGSGLHWLDGRSGWRLAHTTPTPQHRWLSVAVSADGSWCAVSAADGTVGVWRRGEPSPVAWLRGHDGHVSHVLISVDDRWLWTSGWDGTVRRWSTAELW